nr:hypothetical protein [Micromonospora thermarum]
MGEGNLDPRLSRTADRLVDALVLIAVEDAPHNWRELVRHGANLPSQLDEQRDRCLHQFSGLAIRPTVTATASSSIPARVVGDVNLVAPYRLHVLYKVHVLRLGELTLSEYPHVPSAPAHATPSFE